MEILHFTDFFHNLRKKRSKRVGRGISSGRGKTATRGTKGQRARAGGSISPRFEGGQMTVYRRIPKRGFNITEKNRKTYKVSRETLVAKTGSQDLSDISKIKKDLKIPHYYKRLRLYGNKSSQMIKL
jgi:ribosomal protein L15